MGTRELSPREEEVVALCIEGLTNDAIAGRLGLSIGTVNTYWLRIKTKVGGGGRTDTVLKVIRERAERAVSAEASADLSLLEVSKGKMRGARALLQLVTSQTQSVAWTTDRDLGVLLMSKGQLIGARLGAQWIAGISVFELFGTSDPGHDAIAAHLTALKGGEANVGLRMNLGKMLLRVAPIRDASKVVVGCAGFLISDPHVPEMYNKAVVGLP